MQYTWKGNPTMALLIVTGGSGSGKSTWVCEHILRESEKNPKKNYFVIVLNLIVKVVE